MYSKVKIIDITFSADVYTKTYKYISTGENCDNTSTQNYTGTIILTGETYNDNYL